MSKTLLGTVSGLTAARWGTDGAGTSSLGIVTGARRRKDADRGYVQNPDGENIAELIYNQKDDLNFEILALDASALPNVGDQFEIIGITGLVQDAEESYRIAQWVVFTVNVTKFAAMTLGS